MTDLDKLTLHQHLEAAVRGASNLQAQYDKLVDDTILIAAELGAEPRFDAVIARVRDLRETERRYKPSDAELQARESMIQRMLGEESTPLDVAPVATITTE